MIITFNSPDSVQAYQSSAWRMTFTLHVDSILARTVSALYLTLIMETNVVLNVLHSQEPSPGLLPPAVLSQPIRVEINNAQGYALVVAHYKAEVSLMDYFLERRVTNAQSEKHSVAQVPSPVGRSEVT